MNKEIKKQWISALTSGEYQQGLNRLASVDVEGQQVFYCCLGVLCDLAVKAGILDKPVFAESDHILFYGEDECEAVLPVAVQEWAGVDERGNNPGTPDRLDLELPSKNDTGYDFNSIATIIKNNL